MRELCEAALAYRNGGLHPVPCMPRGKKPWVPWEKFQVEAPRADQIESWWNLRPASNIALVLGRGTFAIDLDGPYAEVLLYDKGIVLPLHAPRVKTGKGEHVYLRCDGTVRNRAKWLSDDKNAVDIRGDGGYVIAPPSIHENGTTYEWLVGPQWPAPIAPPQLLSMLKELPAASGPRSLGMGEDWIIKALDGVGEGERNHTCARLAGYFVRKVPAHIAFKILCLFGQRCTPPLSVDEVRHTTKSVLRYRVTRHLRAVG